MTGVLNEMRGTNRLILKESVFHYSEEKSRSVLRFYTLHLLICTYVYIYMYVCFMLIGVGWNGCTTTREW